MDTPIPKKRKPLTALQRAKMFDEHKGICVICGTKIKAGERWIDEHGRALALLGTNDMENRGPAHEACAKVKTKKDVAMIAKAKRVRAKHIGASRPKQPFPGGRGSRFKKLMDGRTVER